MASRWTKLLNKDLSARARKRLLRRFPDLVYFADSARQHGAYLNAKAAVDRKPPQRIIRWTGGLGLIAHLTFMKHQPIWMWPAIPAFLAICICIQMLTQRPLLRAEIRRISLHDKQHCRQCDYSLVGNVSGRCPECGLEISIVQKRLLENSASVYAATADV